MSCLSVALVTVPFISLSLPCPTGLSLCLAGLPAMPFTVPSPPSTVTSMHFLPSTVPSLSPPRSCLSYHLVPYLHFMPSTAPSLPSTARSDRVDHLFSTGPLSAPRPGVCMQGPSWRRGSTLCEPHEAAAAPAPASPVPAIAAGASPQRIIPPTVQPALLFASWLSAILRPALHPPYSTRSVYLSASCPHPMSATLAAVSSTPLNAVTVHRRQPAQKRRSQPCLTHLHAISLVPRPLGNV